MPDLPIGTVTFLFTDVEGSVRLWEEHPLEMRVALARHDQLVQQHVEGHDGVLVKARGEGDSCFAVFARATDSLATALAIQLALHAESWPTPSPLRVRMALHTGEVDLREGDYHGAAVNRCARLRAIAHGGQVLVSHSTYDLVRDALPEGASLRDLGEQRLRDLTRPEPVLQLVHPELPSDFPPLRSLDSYPNNLPLQLTSFVGRERESAEVRERLQGSTSRLLTVTGTGGCGKTRLALQVAAELVDSFPDGVWLVELAPLTDSELVPQAVASALGVRTPAQGPVVFGLAAAPERSVLEVLDDFLKTKALLLMMDNCEHLVAGCAQVVDHLLRTCPRIRVLATSREVLGVAGEVVWRVPSLCVPDLRALPSPDRLGEYEAVRLFADRAALVQPRFAVSGSNALPLAQICQRLDGIPLAIELAAARVAVLSPEQIALRLRDRFRLLAGGSRTALRRQQTLRAAVDWSYDLLSESEQAVLRRLSVFVGGFELEAAEAACIGPEVESVEVLDLLSRLVAKSLVLAEEQWEEVRYHLLETIRQYALEKLQDAGEAEEARNRHRDWYLALAERAYPELAGREQTVWADRLEREHDGLRAALDWSLESDAEGALHLAGILYRFWRMRGYLEEGRRSLALALEQAGESSSADGRATRARALRAAGLLAFDQGDLLAAIGYYEAAVALYRDIGDQAGVARTLPDLGDAVLLGLGDQDRARDLVQEGLRLSLLVGDRRHEGIALFFLCILASFRDEIVEAIRLGEESVALLREAGDAYNTSISLYILGQATLSEGHTARARRLFSEGLELARELGDRRVMGIDELFLAEVAIAEGDLEKARDLARQSVGLLLETRTPLANYALEFLGCLASRRGELHRGVRLYAAGAGNLPQVSGPPLWFFPPSRSQVEADLALARATLGEESYAAAWAEGQAMTLEQAVEYALGDETET